MITLNKSRINNSRKISNFYRLRKTAIILIVVAVGVILRIAVMIRGSNFDLESYRIVSDIVTSGGNVYEETSRYNYGPIWFSVLGIFKIITNLSQLETIFRLQIVSLLTLVDLAIGIILLKRFGLIAFIIFFLNPISIIITGYHNQFDNLAILIGLIGLILYEKSNKEKIDKMLILSATIIGFSLMIKHIFFAIPLFLFIKSKSLRSKLFILIAPVSIFLVSFIPWALFGGANGILNNVFLYKSFANMPLINSLFSTDIKYILSANIVFLTGLLITAVTVRKLPALESGLWYLIVVVIFAPAIANQYLAIAMPGVSAFITIYFIPYIFSSTILLAGTSPEGLHIQRLVVGLPDFITRNLTPSVGDQQYNWIILFLAIGSLFTAVFKYRKIWVLNIYDYLKQEIIYQVKTIRHIG
jgi:hypothetical protein